MQYTKILHDFSIFYPTYVFQTRCPEHLVELEGLVPYAPNAFISATCKIEILLCH